MSPDDIQRAVWRMAHEIIERNHGLDNVVLIGLQTGGVPLAGPAGRRPPADRGRRAPAGQPRRGLLPRRHRPAAGAARGGHRHPLRPRRQDRGAGRRRAVHRPHHPGRPRRPHRLRPAPVGAAGGHGRPRPPGAADPPRLRGQEPAHPPRRGGQRRAPRASSWGRCASEAPALHRRPRRRRHRGGAAPHRQLRRGERAGHPQGADPAGQDGGLALLRGLDPHPAQLRDGGQAAGGRHHDLQRGHVVGEEGRVGARHRRDHRGHGRRRHRRAPRLGRACPPRWPGGGPRRSSTPATAGTSTPPRPCSTATRSAPTSARSPAAASPSSATSSTAGWRAPTWSPSPPSAPRSPWWPRRRCCPRASTAGRWR